MRDEKILAAEIVCYNILEALDYPVTFNATGVARDTGIGLGVYESFEFFANQLTRDEVIYKLETIAGKQSMFIRVYEDDMLILETSNADVATKELNDLLTAALAQRFDRIVESRLKFTD